MGNKRLIIAMTGASGAILGVRMLEALRLCRVESHLVMSKWARHTLTHETGMSPDDLHRRADHSYQSGDMGAAISSGSFLCDGMVVAPCSVASLAAIAHGTGTHLVHRAADVTLKEGRKLVLLVRETPLNQVHLANMLTLARMGVTIMPPSPAFYALPESIEAMVDHTVARALDRLGIAHDLAPRWEGSLQRTKRYEEGRDDDGKG